MAAPKDRRGWKTQEEAVRAPDEGVQERKDS